MFLRRHLLSLGCFAVIVFEGFSSSGLISELFGPSFQTCIFRVRRYWLLCRGADLSDGSVNICVSPFSLFDGIFARRLYLPTSVFSFSFLRVSVFMIVVLVVAVLFPVPKNSSFFNVQQRSTQSTRKVFRLSRGITNHHTTDGLFCGHALFSFPFFELLRSFSLSLS